MSSFIKDLFYEKKQPRSINHILKPKWLRGVGITRCEGLFNVEMWTSGIVTVLDAESFVSIYKARGEVRSKEVNLLGEHMIDFTSRIGKLDVNQCFSLSKPILLNRIAKQGNDSDTLFCKYDDSDNHGVYIQRKNGDVVVSAVIGLEEELVVNDMAISMLLGPDAITRRYGKPNIKLYLIKSDKYKSNKNASINEIVFTWGDKKTKFLIRLECNVALKNMLLEIVVR